MKRAMIGLVSVISGLMLGAACEERPANGQRGGTTSSPTSRGPGGPTSAPGSSTSERGSDSPRANFRMIADTRGRIMVLMTHNTDIGDSWEREGEDREFFLQFSPRGYALGINAVLYALTH